MAHFVRLFGYGLAGVLGFAACGLETSGTASVDPDGGGGQAGQAAGGGVGGTECFPGSKVCPDSQGTPKCIASNSPDTGCATSSCEPCTLSNATSKCGGDGKCAIDQCSPGFADCDGDSTNGCESNLQWAPDKCGTCQTNCTTEGKICEEGACVVDTCPTGTANCDGDKSSCEVDTTSDPNNCAFCTNKCDLTNANSACASSQCVITSCQGSYRDCDSTTSNGCETNSATDPSNCGQCGKVCSSTNGIAGCLLGNCVIVCTPPWRNCDNNADNGCEINSHTNLAHCGGCNSPCQLQNVNGPKCVGGSCDYDSCQNGWGDCDNNRANGCERNLTNSKGHCGTCNNACQDPQGGTAVCSNGACASSCGAPQTLCTNACYNLTSDVSNCGSCGNGCTTTKPNATPACSNGSCGFTCNSGFTNCGGDCVSLQNTVAHCGSCGNACTAPSNGTATCAGATCGFNCNNNFSKCGNECRNLSNDVGHCGSCSNACPAGSPPGTPTCGGGTCGLTCGGGTTACPTANPTGCFNTNTSNTHCGSCGSACTGANRSCQSGSCLCNPGFTSCSGNCVNLQNTKAHCGACGAACAGTSSQCTSGNCTCPNSSDTYCPNIGCRNLQTSNSSCGSCGNGCPSGQNCVGGSCQGGTGGTGGGSGGTGGGSGGSGG
ncbi:MAG: hypothetical protein KF718_13780 [Polyangiaceae bacterium]|nr:hypothetical protein [Polyangiaceae bacterium]